MGISNLADNALVVPGNSLGVVSRPKVSVRRLILLVRPLSDHCQCACSLWESQLSAECEEIEWEGKIGIALEFERSGCRVVFQEDR